jgi:3-oxoacyl-[acyl-carrier protein] reductase
VTTAPHCVVTGSSSGIGLALIRRLLDTGWTVTGIDVKPSPPETAGKITELTVDLFDLAAINQLPLPAAPNSVTAFVHCAGIMRGDLDPAIRADGGVKLWLVNVAAPEALIRRLMPTMPDGRGRIVAMSSRSSQGRAQRVFYSASKAGTEAMVRSFAAELLPRQITANAIAPGSVDTPMLRDPARTGLPILPLPFGRLLEADEIAALAQFLIGPDAGGITGQTHFVCGGASLPSLPAPRG